jgi:hypothetical protein
LTGLDCGGGGGSQYISLHDFNFGPYLSAVEGKKPLGRPRSKWEDNIRLDLREVRWEVVDWIRVAQDRDKWQTVVNTTMNLQVP